MREGRFHDIGPAVARGRGIVAIHFRCWFVE